VLGRAGRDDRLNGLLPLPEVLTLRNDPAELAVLGAWVAKCGQRGGWSPRRLFRVDLALAEAFANVVAHAFPDGGTHRVVARLEDGPRTTTARLTDPGRPFDPLSAPAKPLDTALGSATPGGWGLHLIRHYADRCSYARVDGRNELRLEFEEETPAAEPSVSVAPEFGWLHGHPLLQDLPADTLAALVRACRRTSLPPGEVLLTPGEPNHTLYFVLTGRLRVALGARDSAVTFGVGAGEVVGEMSIIEGRPVSAWVIAEEPTTLLAMPEATFWDEFSPLPSARRALLLFLIARVRNTDSVLQRELERRVRYEFLQRDLEAAAKIQANLLPSARPLVADPRVEVDARMQPAREVSGDFYDALMLDDHTVAVAVGDVSGKGMPAALFMVRVIMLLRMILERAPDRRAVLPALNRALCEGNDECMFVTLGVVVLDTRTGALTYLNAGHHPPFWSLGGRPFHLGEAPAGPLLGIDAKAAFRAHEATLQPGDSVLLYTDGVTEAENGGREFFTMDRAAAALRTLGPGIDMAGTVAALAAAVAGFVGATPLSDDVTILALRYLGPRP